MAPETAIRPPVLGARALILIGLLLAGAWAFVALDLTPAGLIPSEGGMRVAERFFGSAVSPALDWEGEVPPSAPPFLLDALAAVWTTVLVAAAAMGLSLVLGVGLGFLASTAWWSGDLAGGRSRVGALVARSVAPAVYVSARVLISMMRSVHELLWAVIFLAAVGFSTVTAVIAIAIPYGGTLAKVFSEMIDEAPRDAARALRAAGASPMQVYLFGLVPRALPDMTTYAFYRFECATRSAAVMGFFGVATLGSAIRASFQATHYGEVWTYLYLTFLLVVVLDLWSATVRRRLPA